MHWNETNLNIVDIYVDGSEPSQCHEQVHTNCFCEEAKSAFNIFWLARVYMTRIPREIGKYRRVKGMGRVCLGTLFKLLDTMVKPLASVLSNRQFPNDGVDLYSMYCTQKEAKWKLVKRMVNLLRKLWRGSIEKRVVRACIFASIRGRVLYELMTSVAGTIDIEMDEEGSSVIDRMEGQMRRYMCDETRNELRQVQL